jgi:dipeptidyl aminopeptidase/acylaminoacyl peptidase
MAIAISILLLGLAAPVAAAPASTSAAGARSTARTAPVVHPTAEEVAALKTAADVALSPDGSRVVYALSSATLDPEAKPAEKDNDGGWKRERQIWVVASSGSDPVQLTRGLERAGSPVWSPDGREIAFLRNVKGKSALHVIAVNGGEAVVVPTGDLQPSQVRWAPDGKSFAFLATPELPKERKDAKWREGGVIDWARQWENQSLWTVPREGGAPKRITSAEEHVTGFEWSPSGARFLVLTSASADPYEAVNRMTPRVISARDGAVLRTLDPIQRTYERPRWSPDGERVAMLTTDHTLSMLNDLEVYDLATGKSWNVLPNRDPTLSSFVWAGDGRSLIALVREGSGTRFTRYPVDGGPGSDLGFSGRVADAPLSADRSASKLAFTSSTDREPRDPTVFDLGRRATQVLTRLNPEAAQWSLGREEVVRWTSENGIAVEGLLLVSPAAKPGVPAPLLVMPHGGPDDVSSRSFSPLAQFFASHGFSVLRPNYRGSLGYGYDFYAANRGRLGEIEFRDIESGVDHLIASGKASAQRLFFGGWSWGGYLTAWTIGHTTRYRAAVVGAGVNDVFVQYSVSDINHGEAAAWEFRGNPWLQTENFDRSNPIRFVKNVKTPTLLLHGQEDPRVGFIASVEWYRALSDLGVPVRFYAYPREPHGFQEPAHVAHRNRVWLEWYQRYLKSSPTSTSAPPQ